MVGYMYRYPVVVSDGTAPVPEDNGLAEATCHYYTEKVGSNIYSNYCLAGTLKITDDVIKFEIRTIGGGGGTTVTNLTLGEFRAKLNPPGTARGVYFYRETFTHATTCQVVFLTAQNVIKYITPMIPITLV